MDTAQGNGANNGMKVKVSTNVGTLLIVKASDSRVLQIMSKSLLLAIVLLTLPYIGSIVVGPSNAIYGSDMDFNLASFKSLAILFHDLVDEGLLRRGHKGLILGYGIDGLAKDLEFLKDNDNNLVIQSSSNLEDKNLIQDETFDFVVSFRFNKIKAVDRVLKKGGIVITQLSSNPSTMLKKQPNYRVVYLRSFEKTIVAMRKVGLSNVLANSTRKPTGCGIIQEERKAALNGLEDALLEPPRRTLLKSNNGMRKIRFLPDLLEDSLATYERRIFISDEKNGVQEWFKKNYPTRKQHFEMYVLEVRSFRSDKSSRRSMIAPQVTGLPDWLRNNVKEEDFVVMKAEAQLVEELMKEKTMCLVDELFLECKNQWQDDEAEQRKSKMTYWQCLALYGSLRDQGVAVHQWWS
ncbi:uncharacterized protein [Coffea arabica]|uniref:DUF7870 domain-containing protein n=1 Tax=Coffea arabica TaxID=13443 RepID=A0A6P6V847_COFAR|nr:uncharacterized protein LOC113718114 [Coffea arabica]